MTRDELSGLADIIDQVSLEDESARIGGEWRKKVHPMTRPFLKRVMDRVEHAVDEQWLEDRPKRGEKKASPANKKVEKVFCLDWNAIKVPGKGSLEIGTQVCQADDQRELENKLVWGAKWFGSHKDLSSIRKEFEQLRDSLHRGFSVREVSLGKAVDFGGYYCLLCKTRSPDELRASDPEALIEEMAGDLVELYGRLRMPDGRESGEPVVVEQPSHRLTDLSQWLKQRGLIFTDDQLATYYTALQTKGFVLFTGISGTGKTRLAQYFAQLLTGDGNETEDDRRRTLFLSVRPDWRDGKSVLGYYNPLGDPAAPFEAGDLLRFVLRSEKDYRENGLAASPYFVILDEMNLARVEYYFADFLSVLESGRDKDGRTREGLRLHTQGDKVKEAKGLVIPESLRLPPNLYFTGTVNVDDTTSTFSPKVLDRAFTLEFNSARFDDYPPATGPEASGADDPASGEPWQDLRKNFTRDGRFLPDETAKKKAVESFVNTEDGKSFRDQLSVLKDLLAPHELHFAYRVFDDVMLFLHEAQSSPVFEGFGDPPLDTAFDAAVRAKVLPKFHGPRARLEVPLLKVVRWCQSDGGTEGTKGIEEKVQEWRRNREQLEKDRNTWTQEVRHLTGPSPNFCYPRTAAKALRMLTDLDTTGFAAFA